MSLLTPPRLVIPSTRSLPLRPATQFNPHSGRRGHGLVQLILSVPSRLRRPHPSACPCGATPRLKCSAICGFRPACSAGFARRITAEHHICPVSLMLNFEVGECWHSSTSADEHYEIIVRADLAEPEKVLGVLVHELVHAVVPVDAKHGKRYRDAAVKIGLQGKMVHALPGELLQKRLDDLAASLGPLPHARLDIERGADNRGPARSEE